MDLQITVDDNKAEKFVSFLKELDFVVVKKTSPAKKKKAEKASSKKKLTDKDFPYFGACPDCDIDAKELRKNLWTRKKAEW